MDYFTKNKMLFWCIIILVILNVVTMASFWLKRPPFGPGGRPGGERSGHRIMGDQLHLSAEQIQQFAEIRNKHFSQIRPLQEQSHQLRLDLLDEIFTVNPDQAKINELLTELGDKQSQFEMNLFNHFQELKTACNQQQTEALKTMLINLIESTRPRDPQRGPHEYPGPGGPGDFGPPR